LVAREGFEDVFNREEIIDVASGGCLGYYITAAFVVVYTFVAVFFV